MLYIKHINLLSVASVLVFISAFTSGSKCTCTWTVADAAPGCRAGLVTGPMLGDIREGVSKDWFAAEACPGAAFAGAAGCLDWNYRSVGKPVNISGAGMECLDRKSRTWFSGMDAVDISLSLGIRKVVLCGIFFCTILMSMTKVK
ncbi:hypothetical protein GUJ93_ZPchr0009g142 [Zizania palustris]|uniref:Uncharacterized protein n=1 Tax=Zizania palustris TaxID=103762 RepID=A0A8J5R4G2_ZIZPA|nr:hypothetical protein GUJ93_ZPchr0009g142 [Zizania palustris]